MTKLLTEIDRSLPLIQLSASFVGGSISDPIGKEGLTRLLVRMMRRTGGGMDPEQLDLRIDGLGGTLGVDVGTSSTGFSGSVIARNFPAFVDVLRDVVARPTFSADELGRLKRETLAELNEVRDNDRALVRRWFGRTLFAGHPYGRTTTGRPETLEAISIDDLNAQFARLFSQSNLALALAGDVSEAQLQDFTRAFQELLPQQPGAPSAYAQLEQVPEPTAITGRELIIVDKPERTQTQILIGGLGTHAHDADHTALLIANTVFGGTFTARLSNEVRSKRGWSYGAYSSLPYDRKRQSFSMWTFPAATDAAACIALELELLKDWVEQGITEAELTNAKNYLVRSNVFQTDTAAKRMGLLLDEHLHALPANYHRSFTERVSNVTLAEANQAIQSRISLDNLLVTVVGTADDIGDDIARAIPNLASRKVIPFDHD
jgi:zinc protease